jgi:hypothetical protein
VSLRFPEVDYSSARNDFGGLYNAPSYPNSSAFATLQTDGSITAWGDSAGASEPPEPESPHAVTEPSALRAANAVAVE